jgi:hypothetical protein
MKKIKRKSGKKKKLQSLARQWIFDFSAFETREKLR